MATTYKVLTLNSKGELSGTGKVGLRNTFTSIAPDFACVTEVHALADLQYLYSGLTGYSATNIWSDPLGGHDIGIVTKHTIISQQYGHTIDTDNNSYTSSGTWASFLGCVIRLNGTLTEVYVVACHPRYVKYFSRPLTEGVRDGQMSFIVDKIRQHAGNRPIVIGGDFNCANYMDWPDFPAATVGDTTDGGAKWLVSRRLLSSPYPNFIDVGKANVLQVTKTSTPESTWVPADSTRYFGNDTFAHERIDSIFVRGFLVYGGYTTHTLTTGGGLDHKAVSVLLELDPLYVVAPVAPTSPRQYLELDTLYVGDTINIGFENGSTNTDAWIGIYGAADTPGVQSAKRWRYINGVGSGSTEFFRNGCVKLDSTAPGAVWPIPAGNYTAYQFTSGGYVALSTLNFTITAAPTTTLATNKTSYTHGELINVTFSGVPLHTSDDWWIAVYLKTATVNSANKKDWMYLSNTQTAQQCARTGTVNFNVNLVLAAGTYIAYLLKDNGYTIAAQTAQFVHA